MSSSSKLAVLRYHAGQSQAKIPHQQKKPGRRLEVSKVFCISILAGSVTSELLISPNSSLLRPFYKATHTPHWEGKNFGSERVVYSFWSNWNRLDEYAAKV